MSKQNSKDKEYFSLPEGYNDTGYTYLPLWLMDVALPTLSDNDFKLLCCIYRLIPGSKKTEAIIPDSTLIKYSGIEEKEVIESKESLKSRGFIKIDKNLTITIPDPLLDERYQFYEDEDKGIFEIIDTSSEV